MDRKGAVVVVALFFLFGLLVFSCGGGGGAPAQQPPSSGSPPYDDANNADQGDQGTIDDQQPPQDGDSDGSGGINDGDQNQPPTQSFGSISGYIYRTIYPRERPNLEAPPGFIPVEGALISVAGKSTTTDAQGFFNLSDVPAGIHEIRVSKAGFSDLVRQVAVVADQSVTVFPKDNPTGYLARAGGATMQVNSDPDGAAIVIDQIGTGATTPHVFRDLPPGSYEVWVVKEGKAIPEKRQVSLSSGGSAVVNFNLVDPPPLENQPGQGAQGGGDLLTPRQPDELEAESLPPPTAEEMAMLNDFDREMAVCAVPADVPCNPPTGTEIYDTALQVLTQLYNQGVTVNPRLASKVNMLPAVFRNSAAEPDPNQIDVYSYNFETVKFNAQAGFRANWMYDTLLLTLDEAIALLFFTNDVDEYLDYLYWVANFGARGLHFQVVPAELRDRLVEDPDLGPLYADIFLSGAAMVYWHEAGHVNLGHILQQARLDNPETVDELILSFLMELIPALNQPFEYQADIFAAHAVKDLYGYLDGAIINYLVMFMVEVGSGTNEIPFFLRTHPPADERLWIIGQIDEGEDFSDLLFPLINIPPRSSSELSGEGQWLTFKDFGPDVLPRLSSRFGGGKAFSSLTGRIPHPPIDLMSEVKARME